VRLVTRPRRSLLFMPASNARALEKARTLGADGYIFDLEDAVSPENKAMAREQACAAVRDGDYGKAELIIRVNGPGTSWFEDDMKAADAAQPAAILIPKVESPRDVAEAARHTILPLWCMIETPRAILALTEIAAAPQVACLVAGANDLLKELGGELDSDRSALLFSLSQMVLVARAFGIAAIDGVHGTIKDLEGLEHACAQGRTLGFDGKSLIHPDHIAAANRGFSPTHEQLVQARSIISAYDAASDKGVIVVGGQMIEALHVDMARHMVALAKEME
jgi:citrate lyase subunit beta / citryl-CoA lyase